MTKIISFDVGIKNLAYCIFEITGNIIEIVDWSLVNLTEDDAESNVAVHKCNHMLKSKRMKLCDKVAKYRKGDIFACDKHAKTSTSYAMPNKDFSVASLKKQSVEQLKEIGNTHMYTNVKATKPVFIKGLYEHIHRKTWDKIETKKKKNASKVDLISIGRQMHKHFCQKEIIQNIDYAIIENQISPIANRMKTIQGMLTQEFIVRECNTIEYISSSNKLSHFLSKDETNQKKNNYKAHKKDGIAICRNLIDTRFSKWLQVFDNAGNKKDDLADSFLQGLWYIETKINV